VAWLDVASRHDVRGCRQIATENAPATPTRKVAGNEISQPEVVGLQRARARARLAPERERLKWLKGKIALYIVQTDFKDAQTEFASY
jgi:hypothetical protein